MKAIPIVLAVLCLAGTAVAQGSKDQQPGGNIPLAQGPCSKGFENSVKDGRIANLSDATMKAIDKNNDGRISRSEFDSACASKLFKEQDSKG